MTANEKTLLLPGVEIEINEALQEAYIASVKAESAGGDADTRDYCEDLLHEASQGNYDDVKMLELLMHRAGFGECQYKHYAGFE
jgi:hypothetical protein